MYISQLSKYLSDCYAIERSITAGTEYQMSVSVAAISRWLGKAATLNDLTDEQISRWLRDLERNGNLAPRTILGRRGDILAIWRHAAAAKLISPPESVRRIKVPEKMPVAWTVLELCRILTECKNLSGYLNNGLQRGTYFWALLKTAYETGLRRNDLMRLSITDIRDDGTVVVTQHKTGFAHSAAIRNDTLTALRRLAKRKNEDSQPKPDQPLIWPYTPRQLYHWIDKLTEAAGVRSGALQQCRRTGATHAERETPGSAVRYLGHSSDAMARKHYLDRAQAYRPILPPDARSA